MVCSVMVLLLGWVSLTSRCGDRATRIFARRDPADGGLFGTERHRLLMALLGNDAAEADLLAENEVLLDYEDFLDDRQDDRVALLPHGRGAADPLTDRHPLDLIALGLQQLIDQLLPFLHGRAD